jgi:hypothetical protein
MKKEKAAPEAVVNEAANSDLMEAVRALRVLVVQLTERVEDLEEELSLPAPVVVATNSNGHAVLNGSGAIP